jgi:hypothetical protein
MANFAEIDSNGIVLQVIGISNEVCGEPALTFPETEQAGCDFIANVLNLSGDYKQTSYNSNFRGTYAGIGFTYDPNLDVFVAPATTEVETPIEA